MKTKKKILIMFGIKLFLCKYFYKKKKIKRSSIIEKAKKKFLANL